MNKQNLLFFSALSLAITMSLSSSAGEEYIKPINPYEPSSSSQNAGGLFAYNPYAYGGLGGAGGVGSFGMPGETTAAGAGATYNMPTVGAPARQGYPADFPNAPNFYQQNTAFDPYRPPMVEGCAYSGIVQGLSAGAQSYKNSNRNFVPSAGGQGAEQIYSEIRQRRLAEISLQEQQSRHAYNQEMSRLQGKISALERDKAQFFTVSDPYGYNLTSQQQARIAEIDKAIQEIRFEQEAKREKSELDGYFFQKQRSAIDTEQATVHPVIKSIYRNRESIVNQKTLAPLAQDLVSYAGFAVGGPAGLLIGSTVGTLMGGAIDNVIAAVKELLSKPEVRIEELVPLLQEVCRWREFNEKVTNSLVSQELKATRSEARSQILAKIDAAKNDVLACQEAATIFSQEAQGLEDTIQLVINRLKAGKAKASDNISVFKDLSFPPSVVARLKNTEDTTIKTLIRELTREKLSRSQIAESFSKENSRLNIGFLNELRQVVAKSIGNFSEDDSAKIKMVLMASSNRLRSQELQLQRKLLDVLVTEKNLTIEELKKTYKADSVALSSSVLEMELAYIKSMNTLHGRAISLQAEAAKQQPALYDSLKSELSRFEKFSAESPLKAAGEKPALSELNIKKAEIANSQTAPEKASDSAACSSEERKKGCTEGSFLGFAVCSCPVE